MQNKALFEMKHLREENCVKMISLLLGLIRSTELATWKVRKKW